MQRDSDAFGPARCRDAGKGAILSRERMAPLNPQENARGGPLDPRIAGLGLEELLSLRIAQPLAALLPYGCGIPLAGNQVRCTWLRHEASAIRYWLQPRLTIVRRE